MMENLAECKCSRCKEEFKTSWVFIDPNNDVYCQNCVNYSFKDRQFHTYRLVRAVMRCKKNETETDNDQD